MHIKTVILLGNFSLGLRDVVNLSTTFFIQLFLRFNFFLKKRVFNVFYSWGQRFFTSMNASMAIVKKLLYRYKEIPHFYKYLNGMAPVETAIEYQETVVSSDNRSDGTCLLNDDLKCKTYIDIRTRNLTNLTADQMSIDKNCNNGRRLDAEFGGTEKQFRGPNFRMTIFRKNVSILTSRITNDLFYSSTIFCLTFACLCCKSDIM